MPRSVQTFSQQYPSLFEGQVQKSAVEVDASEFSSMLNKGIQLNGYSETSQD